MSRFLRSIYHLLSKAGGVEGEGTGLIHHSQRHFNPLSRRAWEGVRSQKCGQTLMLEKLLVPRSRSSWFARLCSCLFWRGEWDKEKVGCHFLIPSLFLPPCTQPAASA